MAIVVLPRIEQENPFGELAEVISEQALPYLVKLYANKDKIARLSDTELTDFVEVLQRHAPELVVNGKINWEKVNEWAQSDDNTKLKVASFLFDAKRMREDFANAPLIAKLQTIDIAGSVHPQELNKIFVAGKMQQKLAEAIGKSNLSDVHKLLLLSNIEKFAEKPELIPILERILSEAGTSQEIAKTETSGGTGSWQFSLEGSKPFGIDLGEPPQLTPPQVSPPQIPKTTKQGSGGGTVKPSGQKTPPQTNQSGSKQPNISPSAGGTTPPNNIASDQQPNQGMSNLEKLASIAATGLGFVNSLLLGALLYGATRNPRMATKSPTLLKSAEKVATKGVEKGFRKVREVSPETVKKLVNRVKSTEKEVPKSVNQIKDAPTVNKTTQSSEQTIAKLDEILKRNEEKFNQAIKQEVERLKELEKQVDKVRGQLNPSQISYLRKTEKNADELMEIIKKYEEKYGKKENKAVEEAKKSLFNIKTLIDKIKTKANIKKVEKELEKELTKDVKTLDDLLKYSSQPRVRDINKIKEAERKAMENLLAEKQKKIEKELQTRISLKTPKKTKKLRKEDIPDRISLKEKKKRKFKK